MERAAHFQESMGLTRDKSADKAIVELAQANPELKRLFERVTSIIGISQTTAAEIIVTTNEFKSITDPKKFAY